ncbi:unnamed protein product [Dracunculus medinensis]|uniref:Homeobox domain-containing protein n=1 Tax=Dracunculus medinensis TaxID=318479 RepID=A0A0N4UC96_DRAME|nr:unnamed protein product [Dracunculus medinensis]
MKVINSEINSFYQTRFNQLIEVPKLERWFRNDQNPSRQKLVNYMNLLNGSNYRKHNTKITYQQICNWFANQRANHRSSSHLNQTIVHSTTIQPSMVTSTQPILSIDFRPKFDFNTLSENKQSNGVSEAEDVSLEFQEIQRIDGGSDSPTPNDDASVHSTSDGGFDNEIPQKQNPQELVTSSPELSLDLNGSLASTSPKPPSTSNLLNGNGSSAQSQPSRSRLMFDPLTELPIDQYTEALNSCQYRQSYPPISTHNVKIWFKNRRAKCKRMLTGDLKMEKCF